MWNKCWINVNSNCEINVTKYVHTVGAPFGVAGFGVHFWSPFWASLFLPCGSLALFCLAQHGSMFGVSFAESQQVLEYVPSPGKICHMMTLLGVAWAGAEGSMCNNIELIICLSPHNESLMWPLFLGQASLRRASYTILMYEYTYYNYKYIHIVINIDRCIYTIRY